MTTRPANSRNRELITSGGTAAGSLYTENSPLFREYGPCEVKESPIFLQQGISKYGSASRLMDHGTRRLIPSKNQSGPVASFAFPSLSQRKPAATKQYRFTSDNAGIGARRAHSVIQNPYCDASNDEGFHDRDNTCTETSSVSVRTRQQPQTQLESLGSTQTWILLLLPALSAIAVLFFHPNCVSSRDLTSASCVKPFYCTVLPSDLTDSFGDSFNTFRILLEQPLASVNFIDLSMQIGDVEMSKNKRLKYENSSADFLQITNKLFTTSLRDLKSTAGDTKNGDSTYDDSLDKLTANSDTIVSYTTKTYAYVTVLNNPTNLLEVRSLSRAGLFYGGSRFPVFDVTVVPLFSEKLESISRKPEILYSSVHNREKFNISTPVNSNLSHGSSVNQHRKVTREVSLESYEGMSVDDIRLTFLSQSKLFSIWSAVLIVSLSFLSCIMMIILYKRVYDNIYNNNIKLQKKISKSLYCSSCCNWMKFLCPEQFHVFGLLVAAVFWLNPLQSILLLLSLVFPFLECPDYWMFVSKLTESYGRQGKKLKIKYV